MPLAPPTETAVFLRPPRIEGVEALHATFFNYRYTPHFHDFWTVAHVVRGAVSFGLGTHEYLAPTGSVFVIPPGAVHWGGSATESGYSKRVLYIASDRLPPPDDHDRQAIYDRASSVLGDRRLISALVQTHATLERNGIALEQGEALASIGQLLQELIGGFKLGRPLAHPAINAAREYIHEHWQQDFTLDELAREVNLSSTHLAHRFRDQIGMPPSAYRRALRIQRARQLLGAGTPPALTAIECGFYDQSHLNRHFKQMIGVTPSHYASAVRQR